MVIYYLFIQYSISLLLSFKPSPLHYQNYNTPMSRGSIDLVDPVIVTKIVLLRKRFTPHSFQQKIFSYYASRCKSKFQVQCLGDQQTSYGNLPLVIVNQTHIIHTNEFIPFAQALYEPHPELYILQKGVINSCLRLVDFNRVEEIENQSGRWLLFSPMKRLREYLDYKKEERRLQSQNISSESTENERQIRKAIEEFQELLTIDDEFSGTVQYLCLDYLFQHKNEISKTLKLSSKIMLWYKKGIPKQIVKLSRPVIADLKKPEEKKEDPPKKNTEIVLQAIIKTTFVLSVIWMPWFLKKLQVIDENPA